MMKNLKLILLDTHNQLVQNHNWIPGEGPAVWQAEPLILKAPTTQPLIDFVNFLNENSQVQDLLKRHGIDWISNDVEKPKVISAIDMDDPFADEVLTPPSCRLDDPNCESCQ